jgi:protein SCO1/2
VTRSVSDVGTSCGQEPQTSRYGLLGTALRRGCKLLLVAAILGLAACGEKPAAPAFHATDITGASFARDFRLTDHNGQTRTLADYRGKVVMLFFGYTFCPDVCPTTMGEAAAALKLLGKDADQVQVLFATLDPERDTQELLARYVPGFDARFVGLRGDRAATDATIREYRLFAQKVGEGPNYSLDHTAGSYLYDASGRVRLFFGYGTGPNLLAADLRLLLDRR